MPSYEIQLEIPQSPERVYDLISDLEQGHLWATVHHDWTLAPPSADRLKVGDRAHHTVTVWGIPAELRWTVVRHDRPRLLELSGTARADVTIRLAAAIGAHPSGALLAVTTELDGGPLAGVEGEAFARVAKLCHEESLALFLEKTRVTPPASAGPRD